MSATNEKPGLQEREIVALEKVAAMLDELVEEIAGGFAVLTESVDDLTLMLKRKNNGE